ncbi:hypothetical protein EGW08_021539, partial [Elysia chlorotica]
MMCCLLSGARSLRLVLRPAFVIRNAKCKLSSPSPLIGLHNTHRCKSNMAAPDLSDGKEYWQYRYSEGHTEWQVDQVYPMLVRNYEKMVPDGKAKKVFYPMCGTSLELEWLVKQGATVVGVEIAMQAIETYVSNSTQKWTNSDVPGLGSAAKVFTREDKKMKLYCTDIQEFSPKLEGKFDAIYDRGSLQFVPPENVSSYAEVLKSLLKPKGRILQEVLEYDLKIF